MTVYKLKQFLCLIYNNMLFSLSYMSAVMELLIYNNNSACLFSSFFKPAALIQHPVLPTHLHIDVELHECMYIFHKFSIIKTKM